MRLSSTQRISLTILVAALGYFVDVFDLQLFAMVRVSSLKDLGLPPEAITSTGAALLNWQMAGMLVGGILWGILGDRKGRIWVLFGTILLYSLGTLANAFVHTIPAYAAARFFAGLGLAGEIGAGVTLASELLPKETRGYGSTVIISCGVMGPIAAAYMAEMLDWRLCYIGGGVLGLMLLMLRVSVRESGLYDALEKQTHVLRGKFRMFFTDRKRFARYLACIGLAVPIWFTLGVVVIFSPEIGTALGITEPVKAPISLVSYSIGLTLGSLMTGLLSQLFKNRKKVTGVFMLGMAVMDGILLTTGGISAAAFYGLIAAAGFFIGYWTLFLTTTAEQFGTNLRATATTTVANFVRASIILDTLLIGAIKPEYGFLRSVQITAALCFAVGAVALWVLPETFGRDLDFTER